MPEAEGGEQRQRAMARTAEQWDQCHRQGRELAGAEPAGILREVLPLLPPGRALDLAMGRGENAVLLARAGWGTTGVDFSSEALTAAASLAKARGVAVVVPQAALQVPSHRAGSGLLLVHADLEKVSLPPETFDVILCLRYLQRSLFPAMERALRPGGALLFETYTRDQLRFPQGPRNPDYLLTPGELCDAFPALRTVFYREFCAQQALATYLGRKPQSGRA